MTTLSRSFTNGSLAIAGAAAVLGFGGVSQAFSVTQVTTSEFTHQVGDKIFSDFSVTGTTTEGSDTVDMSFVGGNYQVNYNATTTGGAFAALTTPGTLKYKVTIAPGYLNTFSAAGTDAQGGPLLGGNYTKVLNATGLPTLTYNSNGATPFGAFAPGLKTIDVVSSWSTGGGNNYINSFSDKYIQDPATPTTPTPEPSAVLGMLALGLTGVLVRRQKG
jgi:hypothetical protein